MKPGLYKEQLMKYTGNKEVLALTETISKVAPIINQNSEYQKRAFNTRVDSCYSEIIVDMMRNVG